MRLEELLAVAIRNAANTEFNPSIATVRSVSWCCEKANYILNRKDLIDNPDDLAPDITIREIYIKIKNKEKENEIDVWNG